MIQKGVVEAMGAQEINKQIIHIYTMAGTRKKKVEVKTVADPVEVKERPHDPCEGCSKESVCINKNRPCLHKK